MDSATEFLFGSDVRSLGAGLPYPHHIAVASLTRTETEKHPGNVFSRAFGACTEAVMRRLVVGGAWPALEMRRNMVREPMKDVKAFIEPILREAVEKRRALGAKGEEEKKGEVMQDDTLLDYLLRHTDGERTRGTRPEDNDGANG